MILKLFVRDRTKHTGYLYMIVRIACELFVRDHMNSNGQKRPGPGQLPYTVLNAQVVAP